MLSSPTGRRGPLPSPSFPVTSSSGRSYALLPSMPFQLNDAAASLCATSKRQAPRPARARADDAGENAERRVQRPGVDADGGVARNRGQPVGVEGGARDTGPGIVGDAMARHILVGAGRAVAGNGAEDDARVHLAQLLIGQASPR